MAPRLLKKIDVRQLRENRERSEKETNLRLSCELDFVDRQKADLEFS